MGAVDSVDDNVLPNVVIHIITITETDAGGLRGLDERRYGDVNLLPSGILEGRNGVEMEVDALGPRIAYKILPVLNRDFDTALPELEGAFELCGRCMG